MQGPAAGAEGWLAFFFIFPLRWSGSSVLLSALSHESVAKSHIASNPLWPGSGYIGDELNSKSSLAGKLSEPMKTLKMAGLLAVIAILSGTPARAGTTISVNFQGRGNDQLPTTPLDYNQVAGVIAVTNWNNVDDASVSEHGVVDFLTDSVGNQTTVSVEFVGNDSWNNDTPPASITSGNARMMNGIIKANGNPGLTQTVTFTNVPEGQYDVYVYNGIDADGVTANESDWDHLTTYYIGETHQFTDTSTFVQGHNTDPNGTRDRCSYVKFSNLGTYGRGKIGVIVTRIAGGNGCGIAGVQLVNIGPAAQGVAPVITNLPNQTAVEGTAATFTVGFTGTPPLTFEWSRNGTPIPGAIFSSSNSTTFNSYTTPILKIADNSAQYSVKVTNPVSSTNATATLTVTPYLTPPSVVSVGAVQNGAGFQVGVTFDHFLDPASATNVAYYTLASGAVSGAVYDPNVYSNNIPGVILTVSGLTPGVTNTLTVNNVKNDSGLAMAGPQSAQFVLTTPVTLSHQDVGSPALPGTFSQIGVDPFLGSPIWQETGGGSDIYGTADSCHYAFTRVKGDFDVIANIRSLTGESWSKAGLMARQDDGSGIPAGGDPEDCIITTPADQQNTINFQYRDTRDLATTTGGAATPTYPHTWLRLTRVHNTFTVNESPDAKTWTLINSHTILPAQWTNNILVGLAVTRHDDATNVPAVATFSIVFPYVPLAFTKPLPATFAALLGRTVTFSISATGNPLAYQWSKGGVDIPGAIRPTLTLNNIQPSDAGNYSVRISDLSGSLHSDMAVTVTAYPPIPSASGITRNDGVVEVGVTFDEAITVSTLVAGNFTLNSGTMTGFKVGTNSYMNYQSAVLQTTGLTPGGSYTLTVKNISDGNGQTLSSTNINFTVGNLSWAESGTPITPGQVIPVGADGVDILNGGRQEWNVYDEITFAYVKKTNDFDVKVQVVYAEPGSEWTRVGLQARNALNVGEPVYDHTNTTPSATATASAYAQTHVNPNDTLGSFGQWDPADPVQPGNTTPNNGHEQNCRLAEGALSTGWGSVSGIPAYPDVWLRLQRSATVLHGYRSDDGVNWTDQGTVTLTDQQPDMYVGAFLAVETGNIWGGTDCGLTGFDVWNCPYTSKFDRLFVAQFRNFADVAPSLARAPIAIKRVGASIVLSWGVAGTLQSSPVLGPSAAWLPVAGAPNTPTGGSYTNTPSGPALFYRLLQL